MLSVSNQKGLTLIEAMITLVLLSVGMLGVAGMLTFAINGSTASYDRTSGNGVAMSVLESLKSLPFTDANLVLTGAPPGVESRRRLPGGSGCPPDPPAGGPQESAGACR